MTKKWTRKTEEQMFLMGMMDKVNVQKETKKETVP